MHKKLGMVVGAVAAVGTLASVTAVSRAAIMVDDFAEKTPAYWPQNKNVTDPSGTVYVEGAFGSVLGGDRGAGIVGTVMVVPGFDSVHTDIFAGGGFSFFDYSSSTGASGHVQLLYGKTTLGSADLSVPHSAAPDAVRINLLSFDLSNGQPLTISSFGMSGASVTYLPTVQVTSAGAGYVDIPLAGFWSANAGDLNGLSLYITAAQGADFRIDSITLVPEPTTVAGLVIGAGVMAMRRKRA